MKIIPQATQLCPTLSKQDRGRLTALIERRDYLTLLASKAVKINGFRLAELGALNWAIQYIQQAEANKQKGLQ